MNHCQEMKKRLIKETQIGKCIIMTADHYKMLDLAKYNYFSLLTRVAVPTGMTCVVV